MTETSNLKRKLIKRLNQSTEPVLTTREMMLKTNYSRQYIHRILSELEENGRINKKKVGNSIGWYIEGSQLSQLERRLDPIQYEKNWIKCSKCGEPFGLGWRIGLIYKNPSRDKWDVFSFICSRHDIEQKMDLIGEFPVEIGEIETAIRTGTSFAVVIGQHVTRGGRSDVSKLKDLSLIQVHNGEFSWDS
ncbi:hypothetical protein [Halorubrum sp. Hd13]|uniref:hypothetical protein n=1 Tax=Halorubrum sp. Hd13 TaxID=1480728 RepID=UPI00113FE4CB|nr:hypothetical protein [Halorubrum sp. Hd13]